MSDGGHPKPTDSRQFQNEGRIANQVARLLHAGARLSDLRIAEVLGLMRVRGPDRGGMADATARRYGERFADGDLRDWLRAHRPDSWGGDSVLLEERHSQSYAMPLRLWTGVSPEYLEVVAAELAVLADAQTRANNLAAAERAQEVADFLTAVQEDPVDDTSERHRKLFTYLIECSRYDASHDPRRTWLPRDLAKGEADTDEVLGFRMVTDELARLFDQVDPRAIRELEAAQPSVAQRRLSRTPDGAAALAERACLTLETGPANAPWVRRAAASAKELLTPLREIELDASGAWPHEHQAQLRLRLAAAAVREHLKPDGFIWEGPAIDRYELAQRQAILATLRPSVLKDLLSHPPAVEGIRQALGNGVAEGIAWGAPASWQPAWMELLRDLASAEPFEANSLGHTAVRNLRDLLAALESGHRVDPETRSQLMSAMNQVASQFAI